MSTHDKIQMMYGLLETSKATERNEKCDNDIVNYTEEGEQGAGMLYKQYKRELAHR